MHAKNIDASRATRGIHAIGIVVVTLSNELLMAILSWIWPKHLDASQPELWIVRGILFAFAFLLYFILILRISKSLDLKNLMHASFFVILAVVSLFLANLYGNEHHNPDLIAFFLIQASAYYLMNLSFITADK